MVGRGRDGLSRSMPSAALLSPDGHERRLAPAAQGHPSARVTSAVLTDTALVIKCFFLFSSLRGYLCRVLSQH